MDKDFNVMRNKLNICIVVGLRLRQHYFLAIIRICYKLLYQSISDC